MSTEVGKIHYSLDLDDSKFEKSVNTVSDKVKGLGSSLSGMGKQLSTFVTLPIAGIATASFQMAANLEDAVGATNQVFGKAGGAMQDWIDGLEGYYGIAKAEAFAYANTMGSMLQNIGGLTEQEAAKQSITLLKLAGDLTAMFGGTTEDAVRALTGSLKGNNTMLDNYGMAVNDALIQDKAMEMGLLKKGEAMTLAAKQGATLALIEEQSAKVTGQASRESEGASGSLRALTTEMKNLGTEIGGVLMPIIMPLIDKLKEGVTWFTSLTGSQKEMIVIVGLVVAAIGPILFILGTLITSVGAVVGVLSGPLLIVFGLIVIAVMALSNHFGGFENMIKVVGDKAVELWGKIQPLIPSMDEMKNKVIEVKNKLQELWDIISPVLMPVLNSMKNMIINELVPALKEIWGIVSPYVVPVLKVLGVILGGIVIVAIGLVIGILWVLIRLFTTYAQTVRDRINESKNKINEFKDNFESAKNKIIEIKDKIAGGFADLKSRITGSIDSIKEKINGAVEAMKKLNPLQRFSPSLVDNVKRGTSALIKEYSGLFADIDAMSNRTRFNLAGVTGNVSNITQVNTPQPINVSMNVENYYGDQIGLTNFTEKLMQEIDRINITRNNKLS